MPLLVVAVLAARPIAEVLTGFGPDAAVDAAASALPWMVVAGLGQFTAGLLASALAALDDYLVPAIGYIVGSVSGLVLIVIRIDESRTDAVAWGMALNAVVATVVPALWLWRRARRERMPAGAARADLRSSGREAPGARYRRCSPVCHAGDLSRLPPDRGAGRASARSRASATRT